MDGIVHIVVYGLQFTKIKSWFCIIKIQRLILELYVSYHTLDVRNNNELI